MPDPEPTIRTLDDARRAIAARKADRIFSSALSVRRWRIAGRAVLVTALVYAGAQYYALHVAVEILSLPTLVTFVAPLGGG